MFYFPVIILILLGGTLETECAIIGNVSATGNLHLVEYVLKVVQETYGQVDGLALGKGDVTLPNGENIEDYKAPFSIPQRFVFYLAGVDDENRPLWITEMGKWDIKGLVEQKQVREFCLYMIQFAHRGLKNIDEWSTPEFPVTEASHLVDFDGLDMAQLLHVPTVTLALATATFLRGILETYLGEGIIINANFAAVTLLNLVKPIVGGVFNRVTVYGNDKTQWLPKLLRKLPKTSLPPWYGGNTDFKPIKVYG